MGGDIRVEAGRPEGSVFSVRLPLPPVEMDPTGPGADPAVPQVSGVRPLRVLVVEDNSINRVVVREMLERDGHSVEEAHDGQEGVAMTQRRAYDLVLMDISMPVLDGVEATRMIRAAEEPGRHVPVVALTAHALPGEIERFREAGLDDVLVKPISRASLAAVLASVSGHGTTGEPAARAEAALLDENHIEEMRALLGSERTARQIGLFLIETDDFVAEMSRAVAAGTDAEALRASVHRAAGSAAILGAAAFREHLRQLEADLAEHPDTARVDVGALQRVASDTVSALRRVQERLESAAKA
jgi:CheY-like chemotaxis protein